MPDRTCCAVLHHCQVQIPPVATAILNGDDEDPLVTVPTADEPGDMNLLNAPSATPHQFVYHPDPGLPSDGEEKSVGVQPTQAAAPSHALHSVRTIETF